jgi:hypothetical protein
MLYNIYVISYDLHFDKDYEKIKKAIEQLSLDWIKPLESFYIIKSKYDAIQIRDYLIKNTDGDDTIFVIKADANEWGSYGMSKELIDRLKSWA